MAEAQQKFDNFDQWVANASCWLTRHGPEKKALCFDRKNRYVQSGADFQRARDEDTFPVYWIWPWQLDFPNNIRLVGAKRTYHRAMQAERKKKRDA